MIFNELRKEISEKRTDRAEKVGNCRKIRESDYEERFTYRTITRTEFQKRRASFENNSDLSRALKKKTRSVDEIPRLEVDDPYHIQFQEKEMTDKLEDIHRMIKDMQEMTRQLKTRKYDPDENIRFTHPGKVPRDAGKLKSGSALEVVPTRYKSTILIAIGSKRPRYKEEIELQLSPQ